MMNGKFNIECRSAVPLLLRPQYPQLAFESFTQRTLQRVLEIADDEPDGQLPLRF